MCLPVAGLDGGELVVGGLLALTDPDLTESAQLRVVQRLAGNEPSGLASISSSVMKSAMQSRVRLEPGSVRRPIPDLRHAGSRESDP